MKRLDQALVEWGLAPSRNKAQQLIDAGEVEIFSGGGWTVVKQSSRSVDDGTQVRVSENSRTLKYVSRGGLKLESALAHLRLDVNGWRCLDLGLSTGGFTDCLFQHGASAVCGIDVGHDQLESRLRSESRLTAFEGVNVKDLAAHEGVGVWLKGGVDLCVADLSFISLLSVLPRIAGVLPKGTRCLVLLKPQFEVGPGGLDKGGLVRDPGLHQETLGRALREFGKCGFSVQADFPSEVKGQDGNQEYFIYACRG